MPDRSWSYEGTTGPAAWSTLDPAYRACSAGRQQSPIDLAGASRGALAPLRFSYRPSTFNLYNGEHSVTASASAAGNELTVGGVAYQLLQFHYHVPSEHRIGGRSFALELHIVNRSRSGQLLVLGVLIDSGRPHPAFDRLIAALPAREGQRGQLTSFDALALLPERGCGPRYAYSGSLTTPPCTEGVLWHVLARPVQLSAAQLQGFSSIYAHTNRPLQPRNGRALVLGGSIRA